MNWIELAQDRDRWLGTCECGNEPLRFIKCGEVLDRAANQLASQEGLCSME